MHVTLKHFWLSGVWGRPPVSQTVEVSDITKPAETVKTTATFTRSITDSTRAVEQYTRSAYFNKPVIDTSKVVELLSTYAGRTRTFTELIYTLESVSWFRRCLKAVSDVTTVTDRAVKNTYIAVLDYYRASDKTGKEYEKLFGDTHRAYDWTEKFASIVKSFAEILSAFDAISLVRGKISTLVDACVTSDRLAKGVSLVNQDMQIVYDLINRLVNRSFADTSIIADRIAKISTFYRSITDVISSLEMLSKTVTYIKVSADAVRAIDWFVRTRVLTLLDVYAVADRIESNIRKSLVDILNTLERLEKEITAVTVPAPSYTLRYGLTYEQWVQKKAERIRNCLLKFYTSNVPIDLQTLAEQVYLERLGRVSKLYWMPVKGAFTDSKPSPFIKKFIAYLISKLVEDGYIVFGWQVEMHDRVRVYEQAIDTPKSRILSIGLWQKIVETSDIAKLQEQNFETSLQPVKVKRYWRYTYLEIREIARAGETKQAVETIANPPETKAVYARRVLRIPPLYYLQDLCTWKSS
jgi:hypothetical protein